MKMYKITLFFSILIAQNSYCTLSEPAFRDILCVMLLQMLLRSEAEVQAPVAKTLRTEEVLSIALGKGCSAAHGGNAIDKEDAAKAQGRLKDYIAKGADPNTYENFYGGQNSSDDLPGDDTGTAVHVAALNNDAEFLRFLATHKAIKGNYKKADLLETNECGRSVLHFGHISPELAQTLFDCEPEGAKQLLEQEVSCGGTPLHIAVAALNVELVAFYLEKGASVNRAVVTGGGIHNPKKSFTPLAILAQHWYKNETDPKTVIIAELLINNGADLDHLVCEESNETVRSMVMKEGSESFKSLVERS